MNCSQHVTLGQLTEQHKASQSLTSYARLLAANARTILHLQFRDQALVLRQSSGLIPNFKDSIGKQGQ